MEYGKNHERRSRHFLLKYNVTLANSAEFKGDIIQGNFGWQPFTNMAAVLYNKTEVTFPLSA